MIMEKLKKVKARFEEYGEPSTRETFAGELNYESGKFYYLVFVGIFILLPYIPNDLVLHQFPMFLISMKLGLSLLCIALIALRFTNRFRHKPGLMLTVMAGYLYLCSVLIMVTAGDNAYIYISSFSLIIVLPAFVPIPLKFKIISIICTISLFFALGIFFGINFSDPPTQSAVFDLVGISIISLVISTGLNKLRYNSWQQRQQLDISLEKVTKRDVLMNTVNEVAVILLQSEPEQFVDELHKCMGLVAEVVKVDRVYIWKNHEKDGELCCTQIYEWSENVEPQQANKHTTDIRYKDYLVGFKELLLENKSLNGIVSKMSHGLKAEMVPQGIVSVINAPVFMNDHLWGFIGFDDCKNERIFSPSEETILRSVGLLFSHAYYRNEIMQNIKKTTIKLEEALEKATAASKAKSDFLSNMSHEMRTPMNAIIGMTAIGFKTEETAKKDDAFKKIGSASNHLLGIINDVLDMAKIEANKLELVPVEYSFNEMLENVIAVVNFRVLEKKQKLTMTVDEKTPPYIYGDDQRLAQVITNLLSNAIKFTPEKGAIHLDVSPIGEENGICELRIEVSDNGIGLSPEQQERLFLAFEQAESGISRKYGGTGLGLAISKRIIELMDGRIWVESELNKGSKFIFTIKALRIKKRPHPTPIIDYEISSEDANIYSKEGEFIGKRMLLVEDIEINREILITLLKNTGMTIDCAENGEDALAMINNKENKYDVVLMDIQMPHMDGLEATRRIIELLNKSEPASETAPPIIAMTANVFKEDIEDCLAAGMADHIGKPIDINIMIEKLRKYM